MKLSEDMKNYIEICKKGENSLNTIGVLYSYLPEVEQLEKENEEIKLKINI